MARMPHIAQAWRVDTPAIPYRLAQASWCELESMDRQAGPMEDWEEAMAYLHKHARQGSYRVITVKRHVSIGIVDGNERLWSGHCMFPDDGRNSEYEPSTNT